MATPREEYYTKMLDSLLGHTHCHGTPLSSKKLQEAVSRAMEEDEKYVECNVNNITTDNLCQSPVTIHAQKKNANGTNERRIVSSILAETIKQFKGCTIQSTISDYAHSDSKEQVNAIRNSEELVDAVSDPKSNPSSDPKVATYTTNGNFPQKLMKNWFVPKIIQGAIRPIEQLATEKVTGIL